MRKYLSVCMLLAILLTGCGSGGRIAQADVQMGESTIYTEDEIGEAMDIVLEHFKEEFTDCYLTSLWYDEAISVKSAEEWAVQYEAKEAIVLMSNFYTGPYGGDGSLNVNETYENWQWILVRNDGSWELKTRGY